MISLCLIYVNLYRSLCQYFVYLIRCILQTFYVTSYMQHDMHGRYKPHDKYGLCHCNVELSQLQYYTVQFTKLSGIIIATVLTISLVAIAIMAELFVLDR